MAQTEINILEIDSWDSRFQSGVARYLDVLGAHMPPNVRVLRILFHYAPDVTDVRIIPSQNELHVWHPAGVTNIVRSGNGHVGRAVVGVAQFDCQMQLFGGGKFGLSYSQPRALPCCGRVALRAAGAKCSKWCETV